MSSSPFPVPALYAIKLLASGRPGDDGLVGRIEHVLSGRCREFASGAALLACLAQEQSLACRTDGAAASAGAL